MPIRTGNRSPSYILSHWIPFRLALLPVYVRKRIYLLCGDVAALWCATYCVTADFGTDITRPGQRAGHSKKPSFSGSLSASSRVLYVLRR